MKNFIVVLALIVHGVFAMDIEYQTQGSAKPLLNVQAKQYNSIVVSPLAEIFDQNKEQSFVYNIMMKLPKDIQIHLFTKLFETNDKEFIEELDQKPALIPIGLKYFCEIQEQCPLAIGNKQFNAIELLKIPREHRTELLRIGNPLLSHRLYGVDNRTVTFDDYKILTKIPFPEDINVSYVVPKPKVSDDFLDCVIFSLPPGIAGGGAFLVSCLLCWNGCQCATSIWATSIGVSSALFCVPATLYGFKKMQPCCCRETVDCKILGQVHR